MKSGQDKANAEGRKALNNLKPRQKSRITGWGPLAAVLVSLGIYFSSQIIAGYLIIQYLFLMGTGKDEIVSAIESSIGLQFFFILFTSAASLLLLWLYLRHAKVSLADIGIKKPRAKNFIYAIPAYIVYFVILITVFALLQQFLPGVDIDQTQEIGFDSARTVTALSLVFIALVITPAVVEEIMIRGFLYSGLRTRLPVITSAILTSLIFGLAHLQLGSGNTPIWIAAIDTFILSLVLIWLREKTGNIWSGVAVHMLKNSVAFVSLFVLRLI